MLRTGFKPKRTIYFSFGHDEEVGGVRGAASVVQLLKGQGVQLAWSLDEGSFLFDGLLPGVSARTATINVAEKGSLTLQIVTTGAGGHSSMPLKQTVVGVLAQAITTLEEHPVPGGLSGLSGTMFDSISRHMSFGYKLLFSNQWLFGGVLEDQLSNSTFGNAMLRTTTAPTMLSGSVKTNVLPIEAIATVNLRIHPQDTTESVLAHVKSVVENDQVTVRGDPDKGLDASAVSDWHAAGFGIIARAIRETNEGVVIAPGRMIAGSDSRHYGQIADNSYRFSPMVVTQSDLTGFHGTNEKIAVDNLANGVRTYMQIIKQAGEQYTKRENQRGIRRAQAPRSGQVPNALGCSRSVCARRAGALVRVDQDPASDMVSFLTTVQYGSDKQPLTDGEIICERSRDVWERSPDRDL